MILLKSQAKWLHVARRPVHLEGSHKNDGVLVVSVNSLLKLGGKREILPSSF